MRLLKAPMRFILTWEWQPEQLTAVLLCHSVQPGNRGSATSAPPLPIAFLHYGTYREKDLLMASVVHHYSPEVNSVIHKT